MKRIVIVALLGLAWQAQAAIVWKAIASKDCTGLNLPTECCSVASPGTNPACLLRNSAGSLASVRVDFLSDGGTYTAGGDTVNATNFGLLGLSSMAYANCFSSTGAVVVPIIANAAGTQLKLKAFSTAGTELTGTVAATAFVSCDVFGH